jgi:hypothetical protein
MATPNYKGQGQPGATSTSWFGSLFATNTPAYAAKPVTKQAAATQPAATPDVTPTQPVGTPTFVECPDGQIAIVIPRSPIDPQEP